MQNRLRHYSAAQVSGWLAQLERQGLLLSVPGAVEHNLDFTGNFQLAAIRAEVEKLREKSEKIAQLLAR